MSAMVLPGSTAIWDIGSERKRSIRPVHVLCEPERGREPAEADRLDDDPRHQEVGVVAELRRRVGSPPKTYTNSSTNMIGWTVTSAAGPAGAGFASALYAPQERGCPQSAPERPLIARPPSRAGPPRPARRAVWSPSSRLLGLGRLAGQGEEDVVERGDADRDVVHADPGLIEPAHRLRDRPSALGDRHAHKTVVADGLSPASAASALSPSRPGSRREVSLDALSADLALELLGRASGDHRAVIDDDDAIREAVGLVEVLGGQQHRRARGPPPLDQPPRDRCGCAGRGPWSARRGRRPAAG